eukprot:1053074-Pelagomonas_calceolata.AAC.1
MKYLGDDEWSGMKMNGAIGQHMQASLTWNRPHHLNKHHNDILNGNNLVLNLNLDSIDGAACRFVAQILLSAAPVANNTLVK